MACQSSPIDTPLNPAHLSGRLVSRFASTDTVATPSRRERGTVAQMIHTFGECEMDEELFQLRRQGRVIEIEPKVFDVLAYLLRHRGRVVSKDELLDALWPGVTVTESVLPHCVAAARRAVGDDRARQKVIQTVHGRGYLFVASACSRPPTSKSEDDPTGVARGTALIPDRSASSLPFVGREQAMKQLAGRLESAFAGRGQLLLVVGEPGIGKTRVTEEFAEEARGRNALVLVGRCYEGGGAPAFWPWVQILRACLRDADPEVLAVDMGLGAAEIAELVPELHERIGSGPTAQAVEGEQARFRLFDSVTSFLKRAAVRKPLVLVIDDLHWADEASLHLVRFLVREIHEARLLVVATYRDVELRRGHPLVDLLGELARESVCERIPLRGLEVADTGRFIEGILGAPPPDQLTSAVHEMTEGNPFFIREVMRLLVSEGQIEAFQQAGSLPLALPQSVRAAIGRRLDGLPEECNALLRTASVLGREFSGALLERVTDLPGDLILERLDEALAAGVLDEGKDGLGRYAFHHALIRQTLYDELTLPERLRLHRRAGEALEEACGAHPEPHLAELAHHFFQAAPGGDVGKAVDTCVRAAEYAHRILAYEESAQQYERALEALELRFPRDEVRRCELLLSLGEARLAFGARDRARAAFEAVADIARRLSRSDLLAHAALGYRGPAEMGVPPEDTTLALLEEALEAVADSDHSLRARLLSRLVGTPPYANSMERREAMSREAHELARREGDHQALRDALSARLWACLGPDGLEERFAVAREILDLAEQQGDKHLALLGNNGLLGAHILRGDMTAADRALAAYTRIAQDLRQPAFLFQATFCQGSLALARGDFDAAERLFREALERGRGTIPYAHFMFTAQMQSLVAQRDGVYDAELGRVMFGEMLDLPYSWQPALRSALALRFVLLGEIEAARREFEALADEGFSELRRDEHWLATMSVLNYLAVLLEDRRRAELLYRLLEPYADLVIVHDLLRAIYGSVASVLGDLATLLGHYDEGAAHYEQAIAKEGAMGARPWCLGSKIGYARLLLRRGKAGDHRWAVALLDDVEAGSEALGIRDHPLYLAVRKELATARSSGPRGRAS